MTIQYPFPVPPEAGAAIEVAPGVHWIRMPLPFKLDHINLWLLDEGDGWTIVDTGYGSDETHALWEAHFANTMKGGPVKRIVVTHYHPDHIGCAGWLHERTGAPVHMTVAEFLSAHAAAEDTAGFDRANTGELFLAHGLARVRPDFGAAQKTRSNAYKRGVPMLPRQFRRLMENDALAIGCRRWKIQTVYGHAPEHAVLIDSSNYILISGDQVLPRITTNVGVWGNQPEADPLKQFLESLDKFEPLAEDTLVLPSHDRVFTGLHKRLAQLRSHHEQRLAELQDAIATPRSAAEILGVLFRRELDDHQLVFAIGEAIAHLNYLWHAGRATRTLGADGIYVFQSA
jgi:glyoxylase-like metal-dependent hydrolase (beta-lactamase superfamily II)